jgi:hypothetical protein
MQEFQVLRILEPTLRMKHRWTAAREVRKILFVEKRRERLHNVDTGGPRNQ